MSGMEPTPAASKKMSMSSRMIHVGCEQCACALPADLCNVVSRADASDSLVLRVGDARVLSTTALGGVYLI